MNYIGCGRKQSRLSVRYYSDIFMEGMMKPTIAVRLVGPQAEIRTLDLQNTKQE
jgi:hypothetical protein